MKQDEIAESIGKPVTVNSRRDIGIDPEIRRIIGKDATLVKQCKSGMLQVNCDGRDYTVPMTNVDLK